MVFVSWVDEFRMSETAAAAIRAGDVLIADDGFTCIDAGRECVVHQDDAGELFVWCRGEEDKQYRHRHYLIGQIDPHGNYLGFRLKDQSNASR